MIRKVLVANRGEIARRIFRTCREMGISTVAVFSDADARSPFVSEAAEGFALGGNEPGESYLRIERLLEAAAATGADAIHPGYGFLSENPVFARAVVDAGLTWIGPSPEAIEAMGSKLESKRIVAGAGVPTLPSVEIDASDKERIMKAGADIGYPVLVKASAGGGGKGMRIVRLPEDLPEAVAAAQREAASAFGDDTVFIERYLQAPRHIEIQIFGDSQGNVAALFERECSIQRRHQKILEEAPSPVLDEVTRQRMAAAAIAVARAVKYQSAGTVEFLFEDGDFFFLEMNTRLQVEHPVTEEISGLDLVRWQLKVAQGESLSEELLEPTRIGHAIEVRLYAEDPLHDFLPASGPVDRFEFDPLPGLRIETAVESGSEISNYYDPMIAKVIAWGETREEAAAILARALQTARIHGPANNRELLIRLLRHPEFLAGAVDTEFLERHRPAELGAPLPDAHELELGALAALLAASQARERMLASLRPGWRNNPSLLPETTVRAGANELQVGYRLEGHATLNAAINGRRLDGLRLHSVTATRVGLLEGDRLFWFNVNHTPRAAHVDGPGGYSRLAIRERFPSTSIEDETGSLHTALPGKVIRVDVKVGETVEAGQVLVIIEAMKMEHSLRAPHAGLVGEVRVAPGDQVGAEEILVILKPV